MTPLLERHSIDVLPSRHRFEFEQGSITWGNYIKFVEFIDILSTRLGSISLSGLLGQLNVN